MSAEFSKMCRECQGRRVSMRTMTRAARGTANSTHLWKMQYTATRSEPIAWNTFITIIQDRI